MGAIRTYSRNLTPWNMTLFTIILGIVVFFIKYWYISVPVVGLIAFLWAKSQD